MYTDINKHTGANTAPLEHVLQSIGDILTTPIATRIMRRYYGSELLSLVDAPHNPVSRVRLYSAVATALYKEEPRLQLDRVQITDGDMNGRVNFEIDGYVTIAGQVYPLSGAKI